MSAPSIEDFLSEIDAEQVCGPELSYDRANWDLERLLAGRPEVQYGEYTIPAVEPDWAEVLQLAESLLRRTRDLRIAVAWTRAAMRLHGMSGFRQGLRLVSELVQRFGAQLHPTDPDDMGDRWLQLAALRGLSSTEMLGHLRSTGIARSTGPTVRQIEVVALPSTRLEDETQTEPAMLVEWLGQVEAGEPGTLKAMMDVHMGTLSLDRLARADLAALDDDFEPLLRLTRLLDRTALAVAQGDPRLLLSARVGVEVSRIESVHEALVEIRRVDAWLLRTDARNPVRLILSRAARLLSGHRTDPSLDDM